MHLGHIIQIEFTKYLQEAFGAILIVQMSDVEKFYFKKMVLLNIIQNSGMKMQKILLLEDLILTKLIFLIIRLKFQKIQI